MKSVFADTSYYLAVLSEEDAYHEVEVAYGENLLGRTMTTEYVLVELGSAVSRSKYRGRFVPFVDELLTDPQTSLVSASSVLFRHGLDLYATRPDKSWSLVDCISFVVMKQHRVKDALAADGHFRQAGFRPLLIDGR